MNFKEEDVEILRGMLEEAPELLKGLEEKIVALEQSQDKDIVNEIFRAFHSLKGLSGFANVKTVVDVAHAIESILKKIRDGNMPIKSELIDLLLDGTDLCKIVFDRIASALKEHNGGEIEIKIEDLGETELIERANNYFEQTPEKPKTIKKERKGVLPENFESEAFSDFADELRENLSNVEDDLLEFEKNPDPSLLNAIMRGMHSIKGGARLLLSISNEALFTPIVKYIEKISHILEDHLQDTIQRKVEIDLDYVFRGVDLIKKLANNFEAKTQPDEQDQLEIENFISKNLPKQDQSVEYEISEDFATKEAFLNIATQLIEYAEFLMQNHQVDISELNRIAEPLKAGLLMIGCPEKIELVDKIIQAGESEDFEELKSLSEEFLDWLKQQDETSKSVSQITTKKAEIEKTTSQTVRVNKIKLDVLVNLVGELITAKNTLRYLISEVISNSSKVHTELKNLSLRFERLSYDFQSSVMALRMTPIEELFKRYNRTVRDIAKSLKKNVILKTEGEDVEIDRSVIELLSDPLTHLVRNAIDHGIEPPEERKKLGKPEQGTITLRAYYSGNSVLVEIEDDGRGIDMDKVKLKALDKGLITQEQAMSMTNDELLQLIFLPGFSTAQKVSDISGRGVGMDVVKTNVEKIGGKVFVKTQPGKGTTVTMSIPLSLMAIKGLLVKIGNERYIIPTDVVRETLKVPRKEIYSYKDLLFTKIRGEVVPVKFLQKEILRDQIDISQKSFDFDLVPLLVVTDGNKTLALIVDSFIEEGDYLVKNIPEIVNLTQFVTGATVMGDGSIVLILDSTKLAN
ncbi:MAG TPA: chemotaxis protein CheA [Pseudothermotoga sp.]